MCFQSSSTFPGSMPFCLLPTGASVIKVFIGSNAVCKLTEPSSIFDVYIYIFDYCIIVNFATRKTNRKLGTESLSDVWKNYTVFTNLDFTQMNYNLIYCDFFKSAITILMCSRCNQVVWILIRNRNKTIVRTYYRSLYHKQIF